MTLFDRSSTLAAMLNNSQRGNGCVPYDPSAKAPTYGYDPNLYVSLGFIFPLLRLGSNPETFDWRDPLRRHVPKLALVPNTSKADAEIII